MNQKNPRRKIRDGSVLLRGSTTPPVVFQRLLIKGVVRHSRLTTQTMLPLLLRELLRLFQLLPHPVPLHVSPHGSLHVERRVEVRGRVLWDVFVARNVGNRSTIESLTLTSSDSGSSVPAILPVSAWRVSRK